MESLDFNQYLPIFFIVIGAIAILYAIFHKPPLDRLKQTGEHCEGIIFRLGYSTGDSSTTDKITVRFVTKKQEWITEEVNTDGMLTWTGQFKEGQTVPIIYNSDNPKDFIIPTAYSPALVKLLFVVVGFIFIATGIYKILFQ